MKKGLLIIILFSVFFVNAQPPSRFYTKFGGNGDDVAYSAKPTLDRQYIIAGSTSSYGSGNTDVYLVKLDSMGQIIWHKMFGGFGNDIGKSVIQLADSGYVIAGFTNSFGAGGYDAYLVKTDKNGNLIWQTTFGGLDWDFANDLVLGSDNHIYVTGYTNSFGAGAKDGFVVKYDLGGALLWQKYYGGAQNEELRSIIKTNDNFLAAVGYTESRGEINGDGYFLKLDLNGDTLFTRTFGGAWKDYANDVVQKSTGDFIVCGAKTFSLGGKTHSYMYCMYPQGGFFWENSYYASSDNEDFVSVSNSFQLSNLAAFIRDVPVPQFSQQGNIFVATPGGYNYKVNSFGGGEDESFYSVEGTLDGGFLVVGSTLSFNSVGKDVFIMKHDSTCFNYSSIVAVEETLMGTQSSIYYEQGVVYINFLSNDIPLNVFVNDLNGRLLEKVDVDEQNPIRVSFSELPIGIYLITQKYKSGRVSHDKLIIR